MVMVQHTTLKTHNDRAMADGLSVHKSGGVKCCLQVLQGLSSLAGLLPKLPWLPYRSDKGLERLLMASTMIHVGSTAYDLIRASRMTFRGYADDERTLNSSSGAFQPCRDHGLTGWVPPDENWAA